MKEENKREIKFRAWCLTDEGDNMLMLDKATYDNGLCFETSEHVDKYYNIMQYTGLKDCKGVDIYQGDILRGDEDIYSHGKHSIVEFYRGSFIISLCYDMTPINLSEQKMIYKPSDYPDTEKYNWLEGYKVIGNIYQNPELLLK